MIFDTDPGVDDAMALLFLARAPQVHLRGITTGHGNGDIENTTRNALYLKDRFQLEAGVYRGTAGPLKGEPEAPPAFIHGENALGDIAIPAELNSRIGAQSAHQFIIDSVRQHPHQISIVAVGRLTNLALALREAPDIAPLIKEVVIMGGAFGYHGHTGNVTPLAEANIHGDPLAAEEVLGAACPITVVGLDVTYKTIMSGRYLDRLAETAGEAGRFIREISRGYERFHQTVGLPDGFYVNDSCAVAYLLDPSLFTTVSGPVRVVTEGFAEGHTICSREGAWGSRPSQRVCVDIRADAFLELYESVLVGKPAGQPA
ncbi:nucleoside hydrolase [Pararobbsia alpina]|uniref:nucleoside hydrolase n=1 Tax=Pararobbsia alpina TaxID=621374 RepID=UPI0031B5B00B